MTQEAQSVRLRSNGERALQWWQASAVRRTPSASGRLSPQSNSSMFFAPIFCQGVGQFERHEKSGLRTPVGEDGDAGVVEVVVVIVADEDAVDGRQFVHFQAGGGWCVWGR